MSTSQPDIRRLLELYADGELADADLPVVEQALADDPAAGEYLAALTELRDAVRAPVELAAEGVNFDGLFARVMSDVDATATRTADGDLLARRLVDGEALSPAEAEQAEAYVAANADWAEHAAAAQELGDVVRATVEPAVDAADFGLLRRRIDAALDAVDAERAAAVEAARAPEPVSLWARVTDFFGAHRGVMASAVTAMLVAAVMVPMLSSDGDVEIHNHYPVIDGVEYQKGYSGTVVPPGTKAVGDAPIVWFEPAEGSANADEEPGAALSDDGDTAAAPSEAPEGSAAPPTIFEKGTNAEEK